MKFPIPYRDKNKWGFCDPHKIMLISCAYDDIVIPFSDENFQLALVRVEDKTCWIDVQGKQISPFAHRTAPFTAKGISFILFDRDNFNTLHTTRNCLFIDRLGNKIFDMEAITANGFQNDRCIVFFPNRKYGAINSQGEIVVVPEYEDFQQVWEAIGRPYSYDKNELPVMPSPLQKFEKDRYYGFKDKNGRVVIEPIYFFANDFTEDTCMVAKEVKAFHHIDLLGNRLYAKDYYFGTGFADGIAKVVTDMPDVDPSVLSRWEVEYYIPENVRWGYIDKQGHEYWNNA